MVRESENMKVCMIYLVIIYVRVFTWTMYKTSHLPWHNREYFLIRRHYTLLRQRMTSSHEYLTGIKYILNW